MTNDLSQDQRMHRICASLSKNNFQVLLVGRQLPHSLTLKTYSFETHRLACSFTNGFLFYVEYNIRLFFFLICQKVDIINSVDLDTLPAGRLASWLKSSHFTFDAHELFTEVPELQQRPIRQLIWKGIEKLFVRGSMRCYTVNQSLAELLSARLHKPFDVIQNYPYLKEAAQKSLPTEPIELVYQGVLNKGRGLEELIAVVGSKKQFKLHIIGRGDLDDLITEKSIAHSNIILHGFIQPEELHKLTHQFDIGFNLLDENSANYYYSSANKCFDFIMAGIPVVTMNFPEYRKLNQQFKVAELIHDLSEASILSAIDTILKSYDNYAQTCMAARQHFRWENQKQILLSVYNSLVTD